jgi:short subunit fatty acids transporter
MAASIVTMIGSCSPGASVLILGAIFALLGARKVKGLTTPCWFARFSYSGFYGWHARA